MFSPFIATLPGQWPLVFSAVFSILIYLSMFALPTPGTYLPKIDEQHTEKNTSCEKVSEHFLSLEENNNDIIQEFNEANLAPL